MDDAPRTEVWFGNPAPQMQVPLYHPEYPGVIVGQASERAKHLHQSVTHATMWRGFDDPELVELTLSTDNDRMLSMIARTIGAEHRRYAIGVHEIEHVARAHAAGLKPDWVASTDPAFAQALADYYDCPVGEPMMLITNGGRDALHAQHLTTAAQPAAFNYMALSQDVAAELATNTTLPGEITTAGLARAQATYAHTAGTNTSTLTKTFTAVAADVAGGAVVVAKIGVLNAATVGTFGYEKKLASTATINVAGDSVTATFTLTAG